MSGFHLKFSLWEGGGEADTEEEVVGHLGEGEEKFPLPPSPLK